MNPHLLLLTELGPHWTLDSTYWVDTITGGPELGQQGGLLQIHRGKKLADETQ